MSPESLQQRTIARSVSVSGFGYWSGKDVNIEFRPAPVNRGIVFVRGDLSPVCRIPATVEHRIEIPRRTTLAVDGGRVEMVEHIVAALAGLEIDNCEVWVDAEEMPGCDGSSQPFVEALQSVGQMTQGALRRRLVIGELTRVGDGESWVEACPAAHGLSVEYRLDYGRDNPIGRQSLQVDVTPESFCQQLAPARTFLLQQEAEWLRSRGLGHRVTDQDLLVFDEGGPINNTLRYDDECVRHKALDLVGDLALAGTSIVGKIVAHRSGHRLNAELVSALLTEGQIVEERRRSA